MTTFTARTPVDLLAVVPHVIGFHPEDSVVLLTFGELPEEDQPPSFHARVDLPASESDQRQVVGLLREVVRRHGACAVAVLLYTEDPEAARAFADLFLPALESDGVLVIEALRVGPDRFHLLGDADGAGFEYDLSRHPITANAALEGRVVHASRAALRDSLLGTDAADGQDVADAATVFVDGIAERGAAGTPLGGLLAEQAVWLRQWLDDQLADPQPIEAGDAARVLVLLSFEALREIGWAPMTRATAREHVELWRGLLRRAPVDLRPGVGGLLAFAAWLAGDGALSWCAIDRTLEVDADDPLAQYVATLVGSAVPPTVWSPTPPESLRIFTAFD
ncbi:DUF4192 domain-containing protein [Nocardioides marmoriginsengisoli]|uniref:DUF4192 domain-containing protein n=1 Tax=Nocardioides marmoriginsengisoli TaxID=661483 RepID=A0A3N0CN68_9ACTN|nr:DUF4192 domain-containing protein [Nocardioides marmoriginsengisoli]RNL64914.1 DUF4192 domain-containing protein [Nocardioides marmoriginsengisoli]